MKKKVKKIAKKTYSANHAGVLLEEINSKIDLILEDRSSLKDRIDKMDVRLSGIEDRSIRDGLRLSAIEVKVDGLKRDIKDSYKSSTEYLSRIEKEIQPMKSEAKELKTQLRDKADLDRLLEIEKRMVNLEKLVFAKLGTARI